MSTPVGMFFENINAILKGKREPHSIEEIKKASGNSASRHTRHGRARSTVPGNPKSISIQRSTTMAKKAKKSKVSKKANGAAKVAKAKPNYTAIVASLKKGQAPKTSGELIRARIMEHKSTPEQIVAEVKKRFKGSSVKIGDVYWNRGRLKKEGFKVPEVVHAE